MKIVTPEEFKETIKTSIKEIRQIEEKLSRNSQMDIDLLYESENFSYAMYNNALKCLKLSVEYLNDFYNNSLSDLN